MHSRLKEGGGGSAFRQRALVVGLGAVPVGGRFVQLHLRSGENETRANRRVFLTVGAGKQHQRPLIVPSCGEWRYWLL